MSGCSFVFTVGANKSKPCTRKVGNGVNYCLVHMEHDNKYCLEQHLKYLCEIMGISMDIALYDHQNLHKHMDHDRVKKYIRNNILDNDS